MFPAARVGGVVLAIVLASLCPASAAEKAKPAVRPLPDYPRANLAVAYQVDPAWPKRSAEMEWGDMPGVAVDAKDNIWLYTRANPPVQVYEPGGKFVRSWGTGQVGAAHYIRFDQQGNVWLADVDKHVVLQFSPEGKLLKTLGTPGEPGADQAHLDRPTDMVVSPAGDVFVADGYGNSRVVHFDRNGKFVKAFGKMGVGPGEFSLVHSIVMDSRGRLYVADRNNVRIQVFDQDGNFLSQWRNLLVPWGLWITKDDEIWACGSSPMVWEGDQKCLGCPPKDQVLMRFDTTGKVLQHWALPKGTDGKEKPGELNWLHAVALDSHGNVYVGDIIGKRAQKFARQK